MNNKIKICVITGSRAEYGLLSNLIKLLKESNFFKLQLVVTGTHLSLDHGYTYKEIIKDGLKIDKKIDLKISTNSPIDVAQQMSEAINGFSQMFENLKPNIVLLLGDRYEIICSSLVATIFNIPIAHIHGGEVTKGSVDNAFRHSITKMANFHFVASEQSKLRVLQLGEKNKNIYNVGSLGIENVRKLKLLTKQKIKKILKINFDMPIFLITFHSETLSNIPIKKQITPLLEALEEIKNTRFIFTSSNSDVGGNIINEKIIDFVAKNKNAQYFKNLGHFKYLSLMKWSAVVIGNSSSGIIEAPSLRVPTINIGERQFGREICSSILNCKNEKKAILKKCKFILQKINYFSNIKSPYERKNTSKNILRTLENIDYKSLEIKSFNDLKFLK